MLFNSLWFTVGRMIVTIAVDVMAGYSLGNFQFKGRNVIFAGIIVVGLIPIYGTGSATLIMYMNLRMYDTPLFLLSAASMIGGNTLIMMTFFQSLSPAYEEAARMDGAGYWTVFLKIHLPMVWPSVASLVLLTLIAGWNDATAPLYYLPSYPTLATGLYKYETTSKFGMNKPVFFAGIVMCAVPPVVLFGIFREKLMTSVTVGGVK
jgi:ABC-type glycerol-3-phosphate transport system permease component